MRSNTNICRTSIDLILSALKKYNILPRRRVSTLDADCSYGSQHGCWSRNIYLIVIILLTIFLTVIINGCAKVASPPGGPKDTSGPVILQSSPENVSIGVPADIRLYFIIDEWYDHQSFEDAFFISPAPPGEMKFSFGLKKVTVRFSEPLAEERTYIVTVGTGFRDLNRNNMTSSYTLAFSTGYKFDYGSINGRVTGDKCEGLLAALYPLDEEIIPEENEGEYLTQTGEDGSFHFNYLPPGGYRLLVFSDSDNNRLFDPGFEDLAVSQSDFEVRDDTTSSILLKKYPSYAEPPRLKSIDAKNESYQEIILDRHLEFLPEISEITITDTSNEVTRSVTELNRHPVDSTRIVIFTEQLDSMKYILYIKGGVDYVGMSADDSLVFIGNPTPDTLAPVLLQYNAVRDSDMVEIILVTSETIEADTLANAFSLPLAEDTMVTQYRIPTLVEETGYCSYSAFLEGLGKDEIPYINLGKFLDLAGNSNPDSLIQIAVIQRESPPDISDLGSISGMVSFSGDGPVIIELIQKKSETGRTVLSEPGKFSFDNIPSGYYTFEAFLDTDWNGRYDYGLWKPFRFSERFIVIPDSFRVRERWETGGVNIEF